MEQQNNYSTKKSKWQQISFGVRQKIEILVKAKHRAKEISELVGYSKRTIEREMQRGKVIQRQNRYDQDGFKVEPKEYTSYSAEISQQQTEINSTAKGSHIKLGKDYAFAKEVARHIKDKRSPYAALRLIQQSGKHALCICAKTLYNYIGKGYIPNITQTDLPESGRGRKRDYKRTRIALNNLKGTSIEERPTEIAARTTFGHWELDCVEGKQGTKETLLVFSERLTRQELIYKMPSKTQKEVINVLDAIEKELGETRFRKIFKTITCDNGSEFLDQAGLERSIYAEKEKRLNVYYCHPYSAYERGTNENINKMIRRFIPKGAAISDYTPAQIRKIQDHINSCPRLVLDGYPSNTRYNHCTA